MKKTLIGLTLLASSMLTSAWAEPVVLELFTSQGCSSCPPAETYLHELAKNPDAFILTYHVNYWDNLGWKDPFASEANTERQRKYGKLYTPELRVNGVQSVVGSNRAAVQKAIKSAAPIMLLKPTRSGTQYSVNLPKSLVNAGATATLIVMKDRGETIVGSGENAGRTLQEINMVKTMTALPKLTETLTFAAPALQAGEHAVFIIQKAGQGPILAAGRL